MLDKSAVSALSNEPSHWRDLVESCIGWRKGKIVMKPRSLHSSFGVRSLFLLVICLVFYVSVTQFNRPILTSIRTVSTFALVTEPQFVHYKPANDESVSQCLRSMRFVTWIHSVDSQDVSYMQKQMQRLYRLVGSIHYWNPEAFITIYLHHPNMTVIEEQDQYRFTRDIMTMRNVEVQGIYVDHFHDQIVLSHAKQMYSESYFVLLPLESYLTERLSAFCGKFVDVRREVIIKTDGIVVASGYPVDAVKQKANVAIEHFPGFSFEFADDVGQPEVSFQLVTLSPSKAFVLSIEQQKLILTVTDGQSLLDSLSLEMSLFQMKSISNSSVGKLTLKSGSPLQVHYDGDEFSFGVNCSSSCLEVQLLHFQSENYTLDMFDFMIGDVVELKVVNKTSAESIGFIEVSPENKLILSNSGSRFHVSSFDWFLEKMVQRGSDLWTRNVLLDADKRQRSSALDDRFLEFLSQSGFSQIHLDPSFKPITIALLMPIVSSPRTKNISDIPLFSVFLPHFLNSTHSLDDSRSQWFRYVILLGTDHGDRIYDDPKSLDEISQLFKGVTKNHRVELQVHCFKDLKGAPARIWNALAWKAYRNLNADYLFQVNDDIEIMQQGWSEQFVYLLASNPVHPNVGVIGPTDTGNSKILTQSFVHRTHLDIFGNFYPSCFKNWWSDDWISRVYYPTHFKRSKTVMAKNTNVESTRYEVAHGDRKHLEKEIQNGKIAIEKWLAKMKH
jgi:hypothetical protein